MTVSIASPGVDQNPKYKSLYLENDNGKKTQFDEIVNAFFDQALNAAALKDSANLWAKTCKEELKERIPTLRTIKAELEKVESEYHRVIDTHGKTKSEFELHVDTLNKVIDRYTKDRTQTQQKKVPESQEADKKRDLECYEDKITLLHLQLEKYNSAKKWLDKRLSEIKAIYNKAASGNEEKIKENPFSTSQIRIKTIESKDLVPLIKELSRLKEETKLVSEATGNFITKTDSDVHSNLFHRQRKELEAINTKLVNAFKEFHASLDGNKSKSIESELEFLTREKNNQKVEDFKNVYNDLKTHVNRELNDTYDYLKDRISLFAGVKYERIDPVKETVEKTIFRQEYVAKEYISSVTLID